MTASTSKFNIFNGALSQHLGERALSQAEFTGNTREAARVLNQTWDDSFVEDCLEEGLWTFATRTSMFDFSPSVQPDFGYLYSYNLPTDLMRTAGFWGDELLLNPVTRYAEEAGYWFTDLPTVYISYISNDPNYGGDMSRWPSEFVRWMECYLAWRTCLRITGDKNLRDELEKTQARLLTKARSKNAMQKPTMFYPDGRWVKARRGGWSNNYRGGAF